MADPPLLDMELLESLATFWRSQGAPIADRLRDGVSADELDARLASVGMRPSPEVRCWWGWHDGVDGLPDDRVMVGAAFEFLSLDQALREYGDRRQLANDLAAENGMTAPLDEPQFWWQDTWLPISEDGGGGTIAVDLADPELEATPVLFVKWEDTDDFTAPACSSLGELITWWIEAFDEGVWRYSTEARRWEYHWDRVDPRRLVV